jgi:hypothetical protein
VAHNAALPSGRLAARNGRQLEQFVINTLEPRGFVVVWWREWMADPVRFGDEVLIRGVPYQTIFGIKSRSEFVLCSKRLDDMAPIRIECRWQQAKGSVDEKFPYLLLSMWNVPEPTVILLVDGGGAKKEAISWLKKAAETRWGQPVGSEKVIYVWGMSEFQSWVNRSFP